jgi:hypothetical protein
LILTSSSAGSDEASARAESSDRHYGAAMKEPSPRHVFVSYHRRDASAVDRLCAALDAAGISYWRDVKDLSNDFTWQEGMREAIKHSTVFLACFSESYSAAARTDRNEQLSVALEEVGRESAANWFVPIRFDDGPIPKLDLGKGRSTNDLKSVDLFGSAYAANVAGLVARIIRLIDRNSPFSSRFRDESLRTSTKEMLLQPVRAIELSDLVVNEVRRVTSEMADANTFPVASIEGTPTERVVTLAQTAKRYSELAYPFVASVQVAAWWGSDVSLSPWITGVRSMAQAALKAEGGVTAALALRHVPALISLTTVSLACVASGSYGNLRRLVVEPTVRDPYEGVAMPVIHATSPYKPFAENEVVAHVLARSAIQNVSMESALADFEQNRVGRYHTPIAEWLHAIVRPLFVDQIPDQELYDAEFDRAEIMLGMLDQDLAQLRYGRDPETRWRSRSHWFGRSTWRAAHSRADPISEFEDELRSQGDGWSPLRAGLFGGDLQRAEDALASYGSAFQELARSRW